MAKHGSELMRAGLGNSRKELIEDLRQGMACVSLRGQVLCYHTACPLSADGHPLCWLFDMVCHFHVQPCRTIILNYQLIRDLSIRQIAFIPGQLNSAAPAALQYTNTHIMSNEMGSFVIY